MQKIDIAILGGGIAGLWLLNLLVSRGYSVLLLEKEASKLLKKDKEKIVNELTKLLKIVDGDKKIAENTIIKIKTSLKL